MAEGWLRKLELYAFPTMGKLSADIISTEHVLAALQPIWVTKTRTADEVRAQIEQILVQPRLGAYARGTILPAGADTWTTC